MAKRKENFLKGELGRKGRSKSNRSEESDHSSWSGEEGPLEMKSCPAENVKSKKASKKISKRNSPRLRSGRGLIYGEIYIWGWLENGTEGRKKNSLFLNRWQSAPAKKPKSRAYRHKGKLHRDLFSRREGGRGKQNQVKNWGTPRLCDEQEKDIESRGERFGSSST